MPSVNFCHPFSWASGGYVVQDQKIYVSSLQVLRFVELSFPILYPHLKREKQEMLPGHFNF